MLPLDHDDGYGDYGDDGDDGDDCDDGDDGEDGDDGDDGDGGDDGGHLGGGEDRFPILREFSNCAFTGSLIKVGGYTSRGYSTRNWSV